jgi:hypothetical protein
MRGKPQNKALQQTGHTAKSSSCFPVISRMSRLLRQGSKKQMPAGRW